MIFVVTTITFIYANLIGSLIWGFDRVTAFTLDGLKPKNRFTIIIPFRNEIARLPGLLTSIVQLKYPKAHYEIIFVDDDSTDDSSQMVRTFFQNIMDKTIVEPHFDIKVIQNQRLTNAPKKDAITMAIAKAKYKWIITTDADSLLPENWLDLIDECIQKYHPNFIVAPVTYSKPVGFLQNFQLLDILSLQAATIGSFGLKRAFLCNGANLIYKKEFFEKADGFAGNSHIASGDDIFLLEKALRLNSQKVHYLKSNLATVKTFALKNPTALVEQRVRWAAKTSATTSVFGKCVGLIILLQNAAILLSLFLFAIGHFPGQMLFYLFFVKTSCDLFLIYKAANFFEQKNALNYYLPATLYYPFFSVYIAFTAFFKGYKWKGRRYRK